MSGDFLKTEKKARWVVFLFIQLLYFAYRFYYWYDSLSKEFEQGEYTAFIQVSVNAILDGLMVFGLYLLMGPLSKRLRDRRIFFFLIWFVLGCLASIAMMGIHYLVYQITGGMSEDFRKIFMLFSFQIFDAYVVIFVGLGISTAFRWYQEWSTASIRLSELEQEKAKTELEYLKSQINPHFVFNTLNSIYFLIKPDNEPARGALKTFSDMLRYQLYESSHQQVPIDAELAYLQNYIRLQKLRLDEDYRIFEEWEDGLNGFHIPPLLLIIPVENAFKYLSHHPDKPNEVIIRATKSEEYLIFYCENTTSEEERPVEAGGIGLNNLQRRLELLYQEEALLRMEVKNGRYYFELKLPV